MATSLEGFLSLATNKGYEGPLLKDSQGYKGHPPVLKIQGGHVIESGL